MVIFHSYVRLPEGIHLDVSPCILAVPSHHTAFSHRKGQLRLVPCKKPPWTAKKEFGSWHSRSGFYWTMIDRDMAMDQYLLIPFLVGWTSIYQLFWCSPGVQGFDTLPYGVKIPWLVAPFSPLSAPGLLLTAPCSTTGQEPIPEIPISLNHKSTQSPFQLSKSAHFWYPPVIEFHHL